MICHRYHTLSLKEGARIFGTDGVQSPAEFKKQWLDAETDKFQEFVFGKQASSKHTFQVLHHDLTRIFEGFNAQAPATAGAHVHVNATNKRVRVMNHIGYDNQAEYKVSKMAPAAAESDYAAVGALLAYIRFQGVLSKKLFAAHASRKMPSTIPGKQKTWWGTDFDAQFWESDVERTVSQRSKILRELQSLFTAEQQDTSKFKLANLTIKGKGDHDALGFYYRDVLTYRREYGMILTQHDMYCINV